MHVNKLVGKTRSQTSVTDATGMEFLCNAGIITSIREHHIEPSLPNNDDGDTEE